MAAKESEKSILLVGLVCLDIVSTCDEYPQEDQDKRALDQRWQRGGNAANQADVLAQLGMKVEFLGSLSDGNGADFAINTLQTRGISIGNCVVHKGFGFPTSCVTLSLATGSRTIVHYRQRGFPDVSCEDFIRLDLGNYHWVHFEARRDFSEIHKMLDLVDAFNLSRQRSDRIRISIELEKKHEKTLSLLHRADIVIISKDVAEYLGYDTGSAAVKGLYGGIKTGGILVCPWGALGADGMDAHGEMVHSPAYPPHQLKDTLGAGDTFIAGVFRSLYNGCRLEDALKLGCKLAGYKCGIEGYDGLGEVWAQINQ
ncbi:ketohexokinase-like [Actinia tenebrosa]|uniref:Ketohexokinase-like n=1 Tax=Actinia tenebrosa TaxID=6105 RepID=A0A6P8H689_ACTTE|nr:ketohexokinase-like [Actinia tenebrosa]